MVYFQILQPELWIRSKKKRPILPMGIMFD